MLDAVSSLAISPISDRLRRQMLTAASINPGIRATPNGTRLMLTVLGTVNDRAGVPAALKP